METLTKPSIVEMKSHVAAADEVPRWRCREAGVRAARHTCMYGAEGSYLRGGVVES